MYINFDEVDVLKSVGIDYFSNPNSNLVPLMETEFYEIFNKWWTFPGSNGADVRLSVVHVGKRITGDIKNLRIAVYEVENSFQTLILLPFTQDAVKIGIEIGKTMAGLGNLACREFETEDDFTMNHLEFPE